MLNKAVEMLENKCGVIPEKYSMYNEAFLFLAYEKGISDENKKEVLSPFYLVDLKHKKAGPFSPAFDMTGFFESAKNFKKI